MTIGGPDSRSRSTAAAEFIDRLVAELEPLQRDHNQAMWMASVTGSESHAAESARLDARIRKIFSRREPYEFLVREREAGSVSDRLIDRQLALLLHLFRAQQIPDETIEEMVRTEKALDHRFNNFRAELGGARVSDNHIREILRSSNDRDERRQAWEASKQIGAEVVDDLLGLVGLRNRAAGDLGFESYYSMMLELDELQEDELFAVLDELDTGTRTPFRDFKRRLDAELGGRFGVGTDELRPWHYGDPFFQEAPALGIDLDPWFPDGSLVERTERFFSSIGFEIRHLLERADLYEKPGKSQHAFCLSVDRGRDIRVLCNVKPSEFWMATLLHEFGHAVYDDHIDASLPFLLRQPAHTLTTEASAMLFGRLTKNPAWLHHYAGMSRAEARRMAAAASQAIQGQLLVQTRWFLVMCHMERALYRDPEGDLNGQWWDLVERFQGVKRPDGRDAPDWASKIHFSVAPVYYHNYMLGEMMASQLQACLRQRVLGAAGEDAYVTSPRVGAHLRERLYRPGKSVDWREAARQATGSKLDPSAFIAELSTLGSGT